MPVNQEVSYNIEVVGYKPGEWEDGMNCLTKNPVEAFTRLKEMQTKYPGKQIIINKTTTVSFRESISESDLEIDVDMVED